MNKWLYSRIVKAASIIATYVVGVLSLIHISAVILWSPVIMTGLIWAALHLATASADSTRGGSIMAVRPKTVSYTHLVQPA